MLEQRQGYTGLWLERPRVQGLLLAVAGLLTLMSAVALFQWPLAPLVVGHLMYVPIVLAAVAFGMAGGTLMAIAASLLTLPAAFLSGAPRAVDPASAWLLDTCMFVVFGLLSGGLIGAYRQHLRDMRREVGRYSQMYTRVLTSLAHIVEGRDENAKGHCERVAQNAMVLGRALGFSTAELETLYWGALLHDLGKIVVSESILLKPGPLTEAEYSEIKRHPAYGAELLASISPEFQAIAEAVHFHHERWDGRGYPLGLRGETIPLSSRIIAIVDVFEALTSDRPYRRPMLPSQALDYLKAEAGLHFDPRLVALFEELYDSGKLLHAYEAAPEETISDVPVRFTAPVLKLN
jgi:HD-GYP domain-containing protein (c-di-GMP phosphodiesterase class II)